MNVTACIATRGDVDMEPILDSLPLHWEVVIWNNAGVGRKRWDDYESTTFQTTDLGPHGRFAAIEHASHGLIYVQDDDVIVSDPQAIVDEYIDEGTHMDDEFGKGLTTYFEPPNVVVCNMPQEFRPHYLDSAMVGFGAAFHRDAPARAFDRFFARWPKVQHDDPLFLRESCRIFTTLTPRVLVDVPKQDMPYAKDDDRLWKQKDHVYMREAALKMAREAR